jgi:hypothetical protein
MTEYCERFLIDTQSKLLLGIRAVAHNVAGTSRRSEKSILGRADFQESIAGAQLLDSCGS